MKQAAFVKYLVIFFIFIPLQSPAQEWQKEAPLSIQKTGLVETALPPELHQQSDDGLDLKVIGPDGKARTFELFWREDKSARLLELKQKSARLEGNTFVWESLIPAKDRFVVQSLKVNVLSSNYIGTVDIYGLRKGAWINLTRKSALYAADGSTQGNIEIPEFSYEGFRLEFIAHAKKPVPIGHVVAEGESAGRDYAEAPIDPKYERAESKGADDKVVTTITAALPGSGVYVKDVELTTTAQFNGDWILERQDFENGRQAFVQEAAGKLSGVNKGEASLGIDVGRVWKSAKLRLKLTGGESAPGGVKRIVVTARVPRLIFLADSPGIYFVRTGLGHKTAVREYPSDQRSQAPASVQLSDVKVNPNYQSGNLLKQYGSGGGGPFKADGYQWRSEIKLTGPGYYSFTLHQKASLDHNIDSLRIVRGGQQIPYFMEKGMRKECEIALKESYDKASNTTTWHLELPQASSRWSSLVLESRGIFERRLRVERDQPQPVQGTLWRIIEWRNDSTSTSRIGIPLQLFPPEENKIRLVMVHGDNKPIKIEKAKAIYEAPAIYFLADAADGYELFGGNKNVQSPSYDMDLIKEQLRKQEARIAQLAEPKPPKDQPVMNAVVNLFRKDNWALYGVLGLLSLGLIIVIVLVFPKANNAGQK